MIIWVHEIKIMITKEHQKLLLDDVLNGLFEDYIGTDLFNVLETLHKECC